MSIKNRTIAVVCGLALAATALAPAAALADNTSVVDKNTSSTEVTIEAEKDAQDKDQLAFEVPTKIPFAAKADGTLVGPTAKETQIVNKSVFPIHVTSMDVSTGDTGWKLVAEASSEATDVNQLSFKLNDVSAAAHADLRGDARWNMGYSGSTTGSIDINSEGKVANVNFDLSQPKTAATITWTLAAGSAQ